MTRDRAQTVRSSESSGDSREFSRRQFLGAVALGSGTPAERFDSREDSPSDETARPGSGRSNGARTGDQAGGSQTTTGENRTGGNQTTTGGGGVAETLQFGGRVQGWQGTESFQGPNTNPTIQLRAGQRYRVEWKNLDGAPHNFTIQDANGNNVVSTDTVASEGQIVSLTFTASENMAQYICTVHPNTMVGDVRISSGGGGGGNATDETAGGGGGDQGTVPDAVTSVAMLWTVALALTVGLSALILRHFGDRQEPGR